MCGMKAHIIMYDVVYICCGRMDCSVLVGTHMDLGMATVMPHAIESGVVGSRCNNTHRIIIVSMSAASGVVIVMWGNL